MQSQSQQTKEFSEQPVIKITDKPTLQPVTEQDVSLFAVVSECSFPQTIHFSHGS
jgi:hypothetical protein